MSAYIIEIPALTSFIILHKIVHSTKDKYVYASFGDSGEFIVE